MTDGEVRLEVPASPEFFRVARMMAAGVASRLGFTLEEVDDLRIAIDELCFCLVGRNGRPGTLSLRYVLDGSGLLVEGAGHFADRANEEPRLSPLSLQILKAVTDECQVDAGEDGPTFRLRKRRRS
ncbi:MAG TPA: ATP-binding protein [Acidimicrobiales bacterium]|nr:ATP-binding protein [Acidimicrobiales bacterium]